MGKFDPKQKSNFWWGVGYIENMPEDWEDQLPGLIQLPFAYCIHDKDNKSDGTPDKPHVHLMVKWPNNTTGKAAWELFQGLALDGFIAFPKDRMQPVRNPELCYDYLIHDTDDAKKKGKYQYSSECRKEGNNFDIHFYRQIGDQEKREMRSELSLLIIDKHFNNYARFYEFVAANYDIAYLDVIAGNSGHFARMLRGIFVQEQKS